jgi:tetratricopeptide (TPR) repeat protein
VPPDLRAICAKCLKPATKERYEDAAQLAADLERFIDGREVKARPRGRVERFLRLVSGHPVATLAAALSVIVLILLAALYFTRQSWLESQQAHQKAKEAGQALAKENRTTRKSINDILDAVSGDRLGKNPHLNGVRRIMMKAFEAAVERSSGDPNAQEDLALIYEKIARISAQIDTGEDSVKYFMRAGEIWSHLAKEAGDNRYRADCQDKAAEMDLEIGQLWHRRMDKKAEAEAKYEECFKLWRGLTELSPRNDDYLQHFAEVKHLWASLAQDQRQFPHAKNLYLEAIGDRDELVDRNPKAADGADAEARWNRWTTPKTVDARQRSYEEDLARSLGYLGDLYINNLNDQPRGGKAYKASHSIREKLHKKDPDNPRFRFQLARSWTNLGRLAWAEYDLNGAIKKLQEAEKIQDGLVKEFRPVREYRGDLLETYNTLAEWTIHLGHRSLTENNVEDYLDYLVRKREASNLLNKARALGGELAKEDPGDKSIPFERAWTEALTAILHLIEKGAVASEAIDKASKHLDEAREPNGPLDNYRMATLHALLAHCDGGRGAEAAAQADKAMEYLHTAHRLGLANHNYLEGDRSFEVLRSRTDFKVFLRAMKNEK